MNDDFKVTVVEYDDRPYYLLQWRDPITGRKKTQSSKIERTGRKRELDAAKKKAGKLQAELQDGRYQPPSRITWEAFKERYTLEVADKRAASTAGKISAMLALIDRHFTLQRVADLTPSRISQWITWLLDEKDDDGKLVRTPSTVASHCRHLKAVLNWAKRMHYIREVPAIEAPKAGKEMKGRPITVEEYERMLTKVDAALTPEPTKAHPEPTKPDPADVADWQRFLEGLWWSGLRLSEAMALSWDPSAPVAVIMQPGYKPAFRFRPKGQKAKRDELCPMAPEFAAMLEAVPETDRTGRVFRLSVETAWTVGKIITSVGAKAGVVVDPETGKTASAHDFRRAFGTRWAKRVMPAVLKRMMRHKDIKTTMTYYVDQDVEDIAADLWRFYEGQSNKTGNTSSEIGKPAPTPSSTTSSAARD